LNPAVKRYLVAGPSVQRARRSPLQHRRHRIANRLPSETIQSWWPIMSLEARQRRLGGATAWRKSSVLTLIRMAGVSVRYPRLSAADVARVVELHAEG
jgi:hypothetical protein